MNASDKNHPIDMTAVLSQLQSIAASVMDAVSAETLDQVLRRIADASRELVNARYAALGVPDGKGRLALFEISGMTVAQAAQIPHQPVGKGLLGAIMLEREPIRLENLQSDPRSIGFPANHPPMTRFLGVPILAAGELFGMFYLTDPTDEEPFSDFDQWLIETMAGYAGLAIAGARLRDQKSQLALLEERQRISMDLHDGVIQSLYAVGMYLDLMRSSETMRADDLGSAIHSLNDVIEDIRGYIHNLRRRGVVQQTICGCINDLIARLHIPPNMQLEVDAPEVPMPFNAAVQEALCQMTQEAISNVVRHAQASKLIVQATHKGAMFWMKIVDDGVGFDMDSVSNGEGLGLRNIRQRARLHGGDVKIDSAVGRGTTVTLILPVTTVTR
jgi:signal transduction histidine kinase